MPERGFISETWTGDEWFQDLNKDQRYLFIYLWTNGHCNQAGLYYITLTTISNEAGFEKPELPDLLNSLNEKVIWYQKDNLIWVKNFIKRQSKSSKFIAAAAKSLTTIKNSVAIQSLIDYNLKRYSISIPYQYYIDKVSILTHDTDTVTDTVTNTNMEGGSLFASFSLLRDRLVKSSSIAIDRLTEHELLKQELATIGRELHLFPRGECQTNIGRLDLCYFDEKGKMIAAFEIDIYEPKKKSLEKMVSLNCPFKFIILRTSPELHSVEQGVHLVGLNISKSENATPTSESEDVESLSPADIEVVDTWFSVKGFNMPRSDAVELAARLRAEFPDVDILHQSKAWAARKLSEPLTPESRASSQLWNWMTKSREIAKRNASMPRYKGRGNIEKPTYRICHECGCKPEKRITETTCPECGAHLSVDYTRGKYSHIVRR